MRRVIDSRDRELAKLLVHYSTRVRRGEVAIISANGADTLGLAQACLEEILTVGGVPFLHIQDALCQRLLIEKGSEEIFKALGQFELEMMKRARVFIGIRGPDNAFELEGVPSKKLDAYGKFVVKPVHFEQRVKHTRWVVLRYPNSAMAQLAQKSCDEFADFYYRACLVDYKRMKKGAEVLRRLMERTRRVKIVGPGTDLELSIDGIPVVSCCGEMNIPDGECFTAPVRDSVSGTVQFNVPTLWEGQAFENVRLRFRSGRVVEATAASEPQTRALQQILDRDRGARYVGEFAMGFHPTIREPMRDILFDEKIAGSFHMALGQCYDEAPNGNTSQIHWDLVCIQRPEYGGGEIWFDGKLVRKDGCFVPRELRQLDDL